MTQRRSLDRVPSRFPGVVDLDARPRRKHPPGTEPTPEDGTVLDVIPLPGTDKVLMIVAHVVPAGTVEPPHTAGAPATDPGPVEQESTDPGTARYGTTGESAEALTAGPGPAGAEPETPGPTDPAEPQPYTSVGDTGTVERPVAADPAGRQPNMAVGGAIAVEPSRTADLPNQPNVAVGDADALEPSSTADPAEPQPNVAARDANAVKPSATERSPRRFSAEVRAPSTSEPPPIRTAPLRIPTPTPTSPHDETPVVRPEPGNPLTARVAEPLAEPSPNGLHVNLPSRRVWVDGGEIALTFQEFELLVHFTAHPWTVFTRAELMQALWPAMDPATRTVDVHVHRLRRKLGRLSAQLTTVRRVGYVYRPHLTNRATSPSTEK